MGQMNNSCIYVHQTSDIVILYFNNGHSPNGEGTCTRAFTSKCVHHYSCYCKMLGVNIKLNPFLQEVSRLSSKHLTTKVVAPVINGKN